MSQEYHYYPFMQKGKYWVPCLMGIMVLLMLSVIVLDYNQLSPYEFWSSVGVVLTLTLFGIFISYTYNRISYVSIKLEEGSFCYVNKHQEIRIPYEKIERLVFYHIPYLGGAMTLIANGQKILLPMAIMKFPQLLLELKKELDSRGMDHVYSEKKFNSYFKTSIVCWHGLQRILQYKIKIALLLLSSLFVGICYIYLSMAGQDINHIQETKVLRLSLALLLSTFPIFLYVISEVYIVRKDLKELKLPPDDIPARNEIYERKVYLIALVLGLYVYDIIYELLISAYIR